MAEEQKQEQLAGPEEEIRLLEQKLEEKKKELQERKELMPEEKDVFREILREHIAKTRTSSAVPAGDQQTAVSRPVSDRAKKNADDLEKIKEWEKQVEHLVKLALQGSVSRAVGAAEQETPWLLDELHDHLVDDYYEKLVALRKIKNL